MRRSLIFFCLHFCSLSPLHLQIIMQAAKNFAQSEGMMESSLQTLKKMELIRTHIGYQYDAMYENAEKLEYVKEQMQSMER